MNTDTKSSIHTQGDISLAHGNFFNPELREKALAGKSVDLIIADPPYNIADKGKVTKAHGKLWSNAEAWGDKFNDKMTEEEYNEFLIQFLSI